MGEPCVLNVRKSTRRSSAHRCAPIGTIRQNADQTSRHTADHGTPARLRVNTDRRQVGPTTGAPSKAGAYVLGLTVHRRAAPGSAAPRWDAQIRAPTRISPESTTSSSSGGGLRGGGGGIRVHFRTPSAGRSSGLVSFALAARRGKERHPDGKADDHDQDREYYQRVGGQHEDGGQQGGQDRHGEPARCCGRPCPG